MKVKTLWQIQTPSASKVHGNSSPLGFGHPDDEMTLIHTLPDDEMTPLHTHTLSPQMNLVFLMLKRQLSLLLEKK